MFERMAALAEARAQAHAAEQRRRLAERLAERLPAGVHAEAVERGVRLSGRALSRRLALDSGLRWLAAELTR